MKRLLLVLTIAAVMLAMTAAPAFAQLGDIPPPGDKEPAGEPKSPGSQEFGGEGSPSHLTENPAEETKLHGNNYIGAGSSNFLKGPGDAPDEDATNNPGSAAQTTTFGEEDSFNGPVTSRIGTLDPEESGIFPDSEKPTVISALQEATRCDAPEGFHAPASCPEP